MGGSSSSNQTKTTQTNPYGGAVGPLNGILGRIGGMSSDLTGNESAALDRLSQNAGMGGSQFAGGLTNAAHSLLAGGGANDQSGMINEAYKRYTDMMNPYATGQMGGMDSPQMKQLLATIQNDVGGGINQQFAAAGRDMSGANQGAWARGIAQGEAAPLLAQMNQDTQDRLGAITGMFGAGTTTGGILSGFNRDANANKQAGASMADLATQAQNYGPMQQMMIEAQRRGIPLDTMMKQMGIVMPSAQAFGQTTDNTQTQNNPSFWQTFGQATGALGNLGKLWGAGK